MMVGLINRSIEIIKNYGLHGYVQAIQRYFLWHPILDEARWYTIRLFKSPYQINKNINGHKMLIDISVGGIYKNFYLYGCHEPESTRIFSQIIPDGARVADIGANIGYYSLIEARIAEKVYAIEPEPRNVELLRRNIALNAYEDVVEVHQCAISNRTGKTFLSLSDSPNRHRLKTPSDTPHDKDIEVKTITLDEFLQDKEVDVIRMDIEGAEWLVLQGMKNLLNEGKPLILFIEVHRKLIADYGGDVKLMLDLLFLSGFTIHHLAIPEPPAVSSFKRYLKVGSLPKERSFDFSPPLDKFNINKNIDNILSKERAYRLFFVRS